MFSSDILLSYDGYGINILNATLLFTWILFAWESYLNFRQKRIAITTEEAPPSISSMMNEESYKNARLYAVDKINFGTISGLYNIIQLSAILYFGILAWVWSCTKTHLNIIKESANTFIGTSLSLTGDDEIVQSLLFILYFSVFSLIDSLPWSLYWNFVLEEKYGFNKQTLGFFIKDKLKSFFIGLVIGLPITATLIWIIKLGGKYFCIYAYIFSLIVSLIMMFIYPEFIAPLFDRYENFPEGQLRKKIEALASEISFPLKKLLVVEGSKRSSHSNAYFYGLGSNKRIVLFDTLIKGFKLPEANSKVTLETIENVEVNENENSPASTTDKSLDRGCDDDEEILAVLAHELGHWKLNHFTMNLIISQLNLLLMFIVFGYLVEVDQLFTAFGFSPLSAPTLLRLAIIFQFIFMPYNAVLAFLITMLSRKFEFQADQFSVGLKPGEKLKSALLVLTKDNLSFPVYDWLYSLFNLSHPPVLERFKAIDLVMKNKRE